MVKKALVFIFLSLFIATAFAVKVSGLYTGEVPASLQSDPPKPQDVSQALQSVLVKVSGNSDVLKNSLIQQALSNSNNYLQSYSYADEGLANGKSALILRVNFDEAAINQLLSQHHQLVWGINRPLTLIWLSVNQGRGAQLINGNNVAYDTLQAAAKTRGLPLFFPLLDLNDLQTLNVNDVTHPSSTKIIDASKRYSSDAILVINIFQSNANQWHSQVSLLSQGNQNNWDNNASDLFSLMAMVVNEASNRLSTQYGVMPTQTARSSLQLKITHINNLNDYAEVTKRLQNLTPVKDAAIIQITADAVIYQLNVVGGQAALQQALNLDHHFQLSSTQPIEASHPTTEAALLIYQWTS